MTNILPKLMLYADVNTYIEPGKPVRIPTNIQIERFLPKNAAYQVKPAGFLAESNLMIRPDPVIDDDHMLYVIAHNMHPVIHIPIQDEEGVRYEKLMSHSLIKITEHGETHMKTEREFDDNTYLIKKGDYVGDLVIQKYEAFDMI